MLRVTKVVTQEVQVDCPLLPNYILATSRNHKFHISDLSDDELQSIGEMWTEALIAKAQEARARKDTSQ